MTSYKVGAWLERGLWGVTIVCAIAAGVATVHAYTPTRRSTPALPDVTDTAMSYNREILTRAVDSVVASDLFRFERRPSRVAFGMQPLPVAPAIPSLRPHLQLEGVTGGPPWRAVLNGVPNHDGSSIVAPGDTLGGLRVRSIRRDTVIVRGRDTTWTLTMGH